MKKLIGIAFVAIIFAACGGDQAASSANEIPETLEAKREMLKAKKAELKTLQALVEELEEGIQAQDPNAEKKQRLITTTTVTKKDFKRFVEIQGTVQSDKMIYASSEVGGRIVSFSLKEGDMVKKGQLIAKLDLESINKSVDEVNKSLELANEVYVRQKRLWDQNIGSEIQYLQAKNNKERLEQSLKTLAFQLTKANVYAPASGMVQTIFSKGGEVVGPGAPIIEILSLAAVKVVADVPETYIKAVRRGQAVTVAFPALEQERQARVTRIGSMINPANRTFQVEVNLSNGNRMLKPNLLATMMVQDFEAKNAIVLNTEMIQQDVSGRSYVFVTGENEDGETVAQKLYVEMGESYEGETVITSGLKGDESLIAQGMRSVKENELVKVISE